MKVSLLMLTYNAPRYVYESIKGIHSTKGIDYELIVVDNNSRLKTKILLCFLKMCGLIDKLYLNKENSLFAKGNNIASHFAKEDSAYYCLINSDIRIEDPYWLVKLISLFDAYHDAGICSFGACTSEPIRADGYCMAIRKNLYDKYKLDENFEWWWSVTKLESLVLSEGYRIIAVKDHERYLHHYGGASGKGYINAKGMDIQIDEVKSWFKTKCNDVIVIDSI